MLRRLPFLMLPGALLGLTALAAPAHAQNQFENQVRFQLSIVEAFASSVGFEEADMLVSSLEEGEDEYFSLTLSPGSTYRMIALCDSDCSDIDVYLEDSKGNVVDQDISLNDAPVVGVTADGGEYRLRVNMYSCSVEPCYFAVGLFVR